MQEPPERPYPESQAEQLEPLEHVEQPVGHELQVEAPAVENDPEVQAAQVLEPPAEN